MCPHSCQYLAIPTIHRLMPLAFVFLERILSGNRLESALRISQRLSPGPCICRIGMARRNSTKSWSRYGYVYVKHPIQDGCVNASCCFRMYKPQRYAWRLGADCTEYASFSILRTAKACFCPNSFLTHNGVLTSAPNS